MPSIETIFERVILFLRFISASIFWVLLLGGILVSVFAPAYHTPAYLMFE